MRSVRSQEPALRELARCWGVASSYRDGLGRRRQVPSDSLVAVLRSLGAPLRGPGEAEQAIQAWQLRQWHGHVEPVQVGWEGRVPPIALRLPATLEDAPLRGRLLLESGSRRDLSWDLGALRTSGRARVAGRAFVQKNLPLPRPLPYGYHRVVLATEDGPRRVLVISSPRRSYQPSPGERRWGVFLPLYALHSRESWGTGDLTDLRRLVEWTAGLGGGIVASLPLLASFLDRPCEPSPYRPASRLFWNEFYVDVARAVRDLGGARTRRHLRSPALRHGLAAVRRVGLVDYPAVNGLKRQVLETLAREVLEAASPFRREFGAFLRTHPETAEYAKFRAACEGGGRTLPARLEPANRGRGPLRPERASRDYHAFAQWIFERQMQETSAAARGLGVHLYLDLPLGVHPEGFDPVRYPDSFVPEMTVGAPPDVVFTSGQEWGFPPLHPERTRTREHAYFRAVLHHHMRYASVLRIDHVMGLHRLFWIPQGWPADRGTYVRYPAEELYAILCLESHRHRSILVGENLGTVPAHVNASLRRHGISSLYVLHYDLESRGGPSLGDVRAEAVASLNSHDLPPFRGFWAALDIDEREAQGLLTHVQAQAMRRRRARIREAVLKRLPREAGPHGPLDEATILRGLLGGLARSAAWAMIVNLEDLWSERLSQNVPGTSTGVPNWMRKTRRAFEEFTPDASVLQLLSFVNTARRAGRSADEPAEALAKRESS